MSNLSKALKSLITKCSYNNRLYFSTSKEWNQLTKPLLRKKKSKTEEIGPVGWSLLVCSVKSNRSTV